MKKWFSALLLFAVVAITATAAGCGGSGVKKVSKPVVRVPTQTQLVASTSHGVVQVLGNTGSGTGFIIDKNKGWVVTAAHVVAGEATVKVRYQDTTVPAQLWGESPCNDIALLKVSELPDATSALTFGDSSAVKSGQQITVLGFPISLQNPNQNEKLVSNPGDLTADGTVEATPASWLPTYPEVIQHQAPDTYGDSGGPVVNKFDKVVGMTALGNTDATSQSYAVASNYIKRLLPALKKQKFQAYIGISVEPPSARSDQEVKDMAWTYVPFKDGGVAVFSVDPGSPAYIHQLRIGDYIHTINDQLVNSESDLCDILQTNEGKRIVIKGNYMTDADKVGGNQWIETMWVK